MSALFNDVLADLRQWPPFSGVYITLTIHSQADNPLPRYGSNIYFGYGAVVYFAGEPLRPPIIGFFSREYLQTIPGHKYAQVKVLNNLSSSPSKALEGSWGEPQTFLVREPASELWRIRIDYRSAISLSRWPSFLSPPLQITITTEGISLPAATWSVELVDDNGFLRGIGRDPVDANEKALYAVAFSDIRGPLPPDISGPPPPPPVG